MSIIEISRDEFDSLGVERNGLFPERAWFKSTELDLAGTIIRDPFDKDWSYVLVAKDEDGVYRYTDGEVSLPTQQDAKSKLYASATRIEIAGAFVEASHPKTAIRSKPSEASHPKQSHPKRQPSEQTAIRTDSHPNRQPSEDIHT